MLASLAPHAIAAALACAVVLGALRRFGWLALAIAAAGVNAHAMLGGNRQVPPAAGGPTVGVLQWNVNSANPRIDDVAAWIASRRTDVDVVVLFEVTPAWRDALARLGAIWPASHVELRSDNFGIAVLSRLPGSRLAALELGRVGLPSVVLDARFPGAQPLRVVATHPGPPVGAAPAAERDRQIEDLARAARGQDGPLVVVGDLNATPWSPIFRALERDGALVDAERGRSYQPTWAPGIVPLWAGLPLDHVLVGAGVAVVERHHGPAMGSDHRAVVTQVGLTAPAGVTTPR